MKTTEKTIDIFGIGNPLIDILAEVEDSDLTALGLSKGTMHLVDVTERARILAFIAGKPLTYRCGGSAPNTMIALSSFGIKTVIAGKIGRDKEGEQYTQQLSRFQTVSCLSEGREPTGSSIILVTPDTERTMNTFLGANREFSDEDVNFGLMGQARYFYFTGYMWDTDPQKKAILTAIGFCKTRGIDIVFDAADPFAVNRNRKEFLDLIERHVDIVFANREEARLLLDRDDPDSCAEELSKMTQIAIVKDGPRGSCLRRGDEAEHIPVFTVHAIDSTGAGDMYAAGFLYGMVRGFTLRDSGLCASWLASRIVTQYGAQFSDDVFHAIDQALSDGSWKG